MQCFGLRDMRNHVFKPVLHGTGVSPSALFPIDASHHLQPIEVGQFVGREDPGADGIGKVDDQSGVGAERTDAATIRTLKGNQLHAELAALSCAPRLMAVLPNIIASLLTITKRNPRAAALSAAVASCAAAPHGMPRMAATDNNRSTRP